MKLESKLFNINIIIDELISKLVMYLRLLYMYDDYQAIVSNIVISLKQKGLVKSYFFEMLILDLKSVV